MELLKDKVQEDGFLTAKGLGNEVPFWIFDYPPEKELLVRRTIDRIASNLNNMSVNLLVIDLYELCFKLLEDKLSMEKIIQFEERKSSEELLKKLRILLKHETIKKAIQSKMASSDDIQLMFLTRVGKVWPLVRSHSILNNLQPVTGNAPLVTFYSGGYDNHAYKY